MAELNNLLQSEVNSLDSRVKWIEADVIKVRDLVYMLKRSVENEEDQSVKTVLDIVSEDCENILVNDIQELNKVITKVEKLAESVEDKPKRRTNTNRKPRKQVENKTVDMVDKIIEKEKEVVNS